MATITIDASNCEAIAFFSFEAGKVFTIKGQEKTDDDSLNLFQANTAMVRAKEKLVSIWAKQRAQK